MNDIAIGWSTIDAPCPPDIGRTIMGPLVILSLPSEQARTPRMRMQQQVRCFEFGTDLLPQAPQMMTIQREATALADAQTPQLLEGLSRIFNSGQMTLSLGVLPTIPCTSTAPSHWLRDRQSQRARANATAAQMTQAMHDLTHGFTSCSLSQYDHACGSVTCDVLISRNAVAVTRARIAERAADLPQAIRSLHVTGLWPAYAFANLHTPKTELVPA